MICKRTFSKTAVSGTVSWNTDDLRGVLYTLIIKPSAESSTYDFTMTDDQSVAVFDENGKLGTFRDTTNFGLYGIYTCEISNASPTTESFTIEIIYEEISSA